MNDKTKQYYKNYYIKNREKIIQKVKEYQKRTNYAYDKSGERLIKARVRWLARGRYKRGKKRPPCFNCGSLLNLEFHHPDYNNAELYISVCRTCHHNIHNLIGYNLPIRKEQGV